MRKIVDYQWIGGRDCRSLKDEIIKLNKLGYELCGGISFRTDSGYTGQEPYQAMVKYDDEDEG